MIKREYSELSQNNKGLKYSVAKIRSCLILTMKQIHPLLRN
jgi:hypothetical protein